MPSSPKDEPGPLISLIIYFMFMEKSTAEKALDGVLLSKLSDSRYFVMFSAFGFYWDTYSQLVSGIGLLNITYKFGESFPLGNAFILIASFSLLASVISPAIFWVCNNLFWDLYFLLPEKIRPGGATKHEIDRFSSSVSPPELKLWAIKTNNSIAMSIVKEREANEKEIQNNRPQPFLLALCLMINYLFNQNGILRNTEKALSDGCQPYFIFALLGFILFLLYIAFTALPSNSGYIYLRGLKEYVSKEIN